MIYKNFAVGLLIFFFAFCGYSQKIQTQLGAGIDTTDPEISQIFKVWKGYLQSNPDKIYDNPYWNEEEKSRYHSYDLLKSEGFLTPSLYGLQPNNVVLYIKKETNYYIINSLYYWLTEDNQLNPLAITNVISKKIAGQYKLFNELPYNTQSWPSEKIGLITYHFYDGYNLDRDKADAANEFVKKVSRLFDIEISNITYYMAKDCDDIHRIKGFEYVVSMGDGIASCAFYDSANNIVYTTQDSGEFHKHELIHIINSRYPAAHSILLSGLSVYTNSNNSHLKKPLLYHFKKLEKRIVLHPNINLADWDKVQKEDLESEPYYIIGALLVDYILEKGGVPLLKESLNAGASNEDIYSFFSDKLDIEKEDLNSFLKEKLYKLAHEDKIDFHIDL